MSEYSRKDYDLKEVANWLANVDSNGANDAEFAETVVLAYKIWQTEDVNATLTKEDMLTADTKAITELLEAILDEIIYSNEADQECWWKREAVI